MFLLVAVPYRLDIFSDKKGGWFCGGTSAMAAGSVNLLPSNSFLVFEKENLGQA